MALSGTMQLCLDSIEQAPGAFARDLPGGKNTVAALMRRGLAEIDSEHHVFLPAHRHVLKSTMHLDGCHHFSWSYVCECGVTASTYSERSVKADPYSMIWMDDPGECSRCRELIDGARPAHEVTIQRPANYRVPVSA
jgi:hypothetical protein